MADIIGVAVVEIILAAEGGADRQAIGLGEGLEIGRGLGVPGAAADNRQRPLGGRQHGAQTGHVVGAGMGLDDMGDVGGRGGGGGVGDDVGVVVVVVVVVRGVVVVCWCVLPVVSLELYAVFLLSVVVLAWPLLLMLAFCCYWWWCWCSWCCWWW